MRSAWQAVADRALPAGSVSAIGFVGWRATDIRPPSIKGASIFNLPGGLLLDSYDYWRAPNGSVWRRWPTVADLLSVITSSAAIEYFRYPRLRPLI